MKPIVPILVLTLLAPVFLFSRPDRSAAPPVFSTLQKIYEGTHLTLYTSGRRIKKGRNSKSGVWNTPARKVTEMWVQRRGEEEVIRLDPYRFRQQLVGLLPGFPEIHGFILDKSFSYDELEQLLPEIHRHIQRVREIRREKKEIRQAEPRVLMDSFQ